MHACSAPQLRVHLQERCEPPVYVSDRRFMKAVQLLQVAAFADGRDSVSGTETTLIEWISQSLL